MSIYRIGVFGLVKITIVVRQFSKFFRESVSRTTKFCLPPCLASRAIFFRRKADEKQTLLLVVQSHLSNCLAATARKGGAAEIGEIAGAADSQASNSSDSFTSCYDSSDSDRVTKSYTLQDTILCQVR